MAESDIQLYIFARGEKLLLPPAKATCSTTDKFGPSLVFAIFVNYQNYCKIVPIKKNNPLFNVSKNRCHFLLSKHLNHESLDVGKINGKH